MIYFKIFTKMNKAALILALCLSIQVQTQTSTVCTLTIVSHSQRSLENMSFDLYPASFSSPVDNLHNHIFNIFKADPFDACTPLSDPEQNKTSISRSNHFLISIDGGQGSCGLRRRIQMAKDVGAKGVIITNEDIDNAMNPYGDYKDNTFLVFFADSDFAEDLLEETDFFVGSITTTSEIRSDFQAEIWISSLNEKSYQLLQYWKQTLTEIPAIAQKLKWKPRYALLGCFTGPLLVDACKQNFEYVSSCACKGQFCSPESQQKAADAIVKEDIRQRIIFDQYKNKYLAYTSSFKQKCYDNFKKDNYVEACSGSLMSVIGINNTKIQKQLDNFGMECSGDIYQELLLDRNRFSQLGYYPAFMMNRQPIDHGSKNQLQDSLCRKLGLEKEKGCAEAIRYHTIIKTTVHILFFIGIVGGLAAVGAFTVFWYRKSLRKQMQKEVKMQVSASIEHYFALTDTK